jgi:hypothetical protein
VAKSSSDYTPLGGFVFQPDLTMRPTALSDFEQGSTDPRPSWASVWHIWTVFIPRRSIDGSLIWGRVWRRHDGRHWIYKRLADIEELH